MFRGDELLYDCCQLQQENSGRFCQKSTDRSFGQFAQGGGKIVQFFAIFLHHFAQILRYFGKVFAMFCNIWQLLATFPKATPISSPKMRVQTRVPALSLP